jgi:hypothetical protein
MAYLIVREYVSARWLRYVICLVNVADCTALSSKGSDEDIAACNASIPAGASGSCYVYKCDKNILLSRGIFCYGLGADFHDEGIVKLVQHLDKCLNRNGDCVEK